MSVTFFSDATSNKTCKEEHCLCAQFAEGWMRDATPEALRAAADPKCSACGGSGVEMVIVDDRPELNVANGNARLLLAALRLDDSELIGRITLPEARRALIRARAGSLEPFTRQAFIEHGAPRSEGDVVALRPVRVFAASLDEHQMAGYLDSFEALVMGAEASGAKYIHWC